jgi:hypothetical protein
VPVITTKGAPWAELLGSGESALSAISRGSELSGGSEPNAISQGDESEIESGMVYSQKLNAPNALNALNAPNTPNALNQLNSLAPATGRCGWWIDIGVAPLAEALREAMSLTDEERRALGENGRRLVESKYRWETVAGEMAAVYSGIVNRKP